MIVRSEGVSKAIHVSIGAWALGLCLGRRTSACVRGARRACDRCRRRRETSSDGRTVERGRASRRVDAMGKRKSSKPPPKKVAPKVDTTFTCPFCNHDKSVFARLDHVSEKGLVECATCGQKYTCNITHLSEPIDVYSDWIDACEKINARDEDEDDEA